MEGGIGWWKQITDALDEVEFLILVVTPASLESDVVQKEWRYARQVGVCVHPVNAASDAKLDFDRMPKWMSSAHFFDLAKQWDTFVNFLKSPCNAARVPFMAPDLPTHSIERNAPFARLLDCVLDPAHANPRAIKVALHGSGGFGKTTVAAQLCHDEDVITAFVDGVLWVTLGEQPNALAELTKLYAALTGERPEFVNEDDAALAVARRLADRHCLLVIDDVWDQSALAPFLRGGEHCARLITTRQFDIAVQKADERIAIDEMTETEAMALLGQYLDGHSAPPAALRALAHRMGEWPILLELAGGALKQRLVRGDTVEDALKYLNQALDHEGVVAFDRRVARERRDAVSRTLAVSLDLLSEAEREQYRALAVFPEDAAVPIGVVATLLRLDAFATEKILTTCDDLSLLKLDLRTDTVHLHDVMRAYLATGQTNAPTLHARLADAWPTVDRLADGYAWRYVAYHMAEAMLGAGEDERHQRTTRLVDLVTSTAFRNGHLLHVTDLPALRQDMDRALLCAQRDTCDGASLLVARAALARSSMVELNPEQLFALAREGKLDKADVLLTLFDPDARWRFAASLVLAWQAASTGHAAQATALLARLTTELPAADHTLGAMLSYVRSASAGGVPVPAMPLPAPPDLFIITELIKRLGGTSLTPVEPLLASGLTQLGDGAPTFLAEQDGPLLVAFAQADPKNNATYCKQYIASQSSNPYRYYRDRSLWALLPSILRSTVAPLAFDLLHDVTAGALAPTRIDFRWMLPLVVRALRARAGDAGALAALDQDRHDTLARLDALSPQRGEGDPWAFLMRRLAALAEVYARVLDRPAEVAEVLDRAAGMHHEYNFAGFRAPACLTVAEAMRVCGRDDPGAIALVIDQALAGAHNIQDAEFCAQMTARVNAMVERWWPAPPAALDIEADVARLESVPADPELGSVHRVGDTYRHRSDLPTRLPLPYGMREARTLRQIVLFYPSMRALPAERVLALNPQLGLAGPAAVDQPLAPGASVRIADEDFAPWIAARLAAEALAVPSASADQRSAWLRRLVPVAATNATTLDAVLARSLMTAPIGDLGALETLQQAAEELAKRA